MFLASHWQRVQLVETETRLYRCWFVASYNLALGFDFGSAGYDPKYPEIISLEIFAEGSS